MNIENFKPFPVTIEEVFDKQLELADKYEPGFKKTVEEFDIDCAEDQETFKLFCWRLTEEIGEMIEAHYLSETKHAQEEFIDTFNFAVELFLLAGWKPGAGIEYFAIPTHLLCPSFTEASLGVISHLTKCANLLKNRRWRQSQYLVDTLEFEKAMKGLWDSIMLLAGANKLCASQVLSLWSQKYQVNEFRINSNY